MVVTIVIALLALIGMAFLVAASYMALKTVFAAAIAAAIVGGGLVLIAGFLWLVSEALANRRRSKGGVLPVAQAAVGAQSGDDAIHQIVGALKHESPLSVLAAAAGILVGLFLQGRRS